MSKMMVRTGMSMEVKRYSRIRRILVVRGLGGRLMDLKMVAMAVPTAAKLTGAAAIENRAATSRASCEHNCGTGWEADIECGL